MDTKSDNAEVPPPPLRLSLKDLPRVNVRLTGASVVHHESSGSGLPQSAATQFLGRCISRAQRVRVAALDNISAEFPAGSSTVVLAAPGSGSSTLLRLVSGRVPSTPASAVTWSGADATALKVAGVSLARIAAYCREADEHEAHLTVRETLHFAHSTGVVAPTSTHANTGAHGSDEYSIPSVEDVIAAMGLTTAGDTIAGGMLARGLSGGERRRLSVAETLVLNRRVVCLDKPTDGLDAATAFSTMRYATSLARTSGGTLVAALQQPTPETLSLFDLVLLLSDGRIIYHGPGGDALDEYLRSIGLPRPSYADIAEWCLEVVSNPAGAASAALEDRAETEGAGSGAGGFAKPALTTAAALADAWAAEPRLPAVSAEPRAPATDDIAALPSHLLATPYARAQYGSPSLVGALVAFTSHARLIVARELRLSARNWVYIAARIVLTAGMGLVLGSVFAYIDNSASCCTISGTPPPYLKFSALLYALTFIAFLNQSSVPFTMVSRAVAYKLTEAGLFGELPYVISVLAASAPLAVATDVLFAIPFYFLVTLASDAGRFFFFLLVVVLQDFATSTLYRALAYAAPSEEGAMVACGLLIAVGLSLGNYFVIATQVGWWLRWLIYISPFYWSETAAVNNEFSSPQYASPYPGSPPGSSSQGTIIMASFDFPFSLAAQWGGIGVLLAWWLVGGILLTYVTLKCLRHDVTRRGTRRTPADASPGSTSLVEPHASPVVISIPATPPAEQSRSTQNAEVMPPVPRITYAFSDVTYIVRVPRAADSTPADGGTPFVGGTPREGGAQRESGSKRLVDKVLLRGVTGYFEPGTMTALLGASGAGKSTLLDVLAFRKTSGSVTGVLKLNGRPATRAMLACTSGYSEQADIHVPHATVREALAFSAALRLPPGTSAAGRARVVDDVLALLELTPVAGRLVGSLGASEAKRLTLGVELAANVPILFCDEPTTGLDSRSAAVIMRVLRRVALSGRTVVATIHAPSSEIFFSFDRAVVLSHGAVTYAGAIGHHAHDVAAFYAAVPGVRPLPPHVNPATWLLEIQHEGRAAGIDFAGAYAASPLAAKNAESFSQSVAAGGVAPGDHTARASSAAQLYELLVRSSTILWREGNYGVARTYGILGVSLFYGLLFLVIDDTFAGVQSRFGSILAAMGFCGLLLFTIAIPHYTRLRAVFYREAHLYSRGLYGAALAIAEFPWLVLYAMLFTVIFTPMARFNMSAGPFLTYFAGALITIGGFLYAGIAASALLPSAVIAQIAGGAFLAVIWLFAYVFVPWGYLPAWWRWFSLIDFAAHAVRAITTTEFYCEGGGCATMSVATSAGPVMMPTYDYMAKLVGSTYGDVGAELGYAALIVFGIILGAVAAHFINWQRR